MKAKIACAVLLCMMGYGTGAMASGEKRGLPPVVIPVIPKVVINAVNGHSNENSSIPLTFVAGEIVDEIKTDGTNSLVKRNYTYKESMWIPSKLLVGMSAFKPLSVWHGEKEYEIVAGDYYAKYYFKPDGSFKLDESEMSVTEGGANIYKMVTHYGCLYKAKNVIWARKNNVRDESFGDERMHIFLLQPDGKLINPDFY